MATGNRNQIDAWGKRVYGGNSASPEVQANQRRGTMATVANVYQQRGGTYQNPSGFGDPGKPLDSTLYKQAEKDAYMGELRNEDTGFGSYGRGLRYVMDSRDANDEVKRRDEQDRAELEQGYKDKEEDNAWEREKRGWQRDAWKKVNKMSSGGAGGGVGGNYGVTGLR